jgi:hypothetical protein
MHSALPLLDRQQAEAAAAAAIELMIAGLHSTPA